MTDPFVFAVAVAASGFVILAAGLVLICAIADARSNRR